MKSLKKDKKEKYLVYLKTDLFLPLDLTKSVKEEVLKQRKKLESEFDKS
jgi:hypothetical protein